MSGDDKCCDVFRVDLTFRNSEVEGTADVEAAVLSLIVVEVEGWTTRACGRAVGPIP
jgi:hypothetical protein